MGCFDNSTENYIGVHFYVFSRPSIMTERQVHFVSKVAVMKSQMERESKTLVTVEWGAMKQEG